MDILSQETLRLLRDENVRKTVREVLENVESVEPKTVTTEKVDKQGPTRVTVRRLSV